MLGLIISGIIIITISFNYIHCFTFPFIVNIYRQSKMSNFIELIAKNLPNHKIDFFGHDSLMFNSFPYYFYTALIIMFTIWPQHPSYLLFTVYAIVPLLDTIISFDVRNPTEKERQKLQKDVTFNLALYIHVIIDWVCFFMLLNYFSSFQVTMNSFPNLFLSVYAFSGLMSGQFAIAHEIFHRTDLFHRILGTLHMSKNLYMHFTYNHIHIHHKRVATPEDPASAQKDQTYYQFLPRSFFGTYRTVYYDQKNKGTPFYLNYAVLSVLQAIFFPLVITYFYGLQAGIIFTIVAFISIFYLQGINYIQHYGLRRKKLPDGTYEKTTIMHSWNAPHRISNYLLFKLQRHSDHHENCLKPYQTLVSLPQSPLLPHGYTAMIILCFVPQKFFAIMNPLLNDESNPLQKKDKQLIYKQSQILAKKFVVECAITFGIVSLVGQIFH